MSPAPEQERQPNVVALSLRTNKGWTQRRQAATFREIGERLAIGGLPDNLDTIVREIRRVERGYIQSPDEMYVRLWTEAFGCDRTEIFGHLDPGESNRERFAVTSHKFVPIPVGCDAITQLWGQAVAADGQHTECRTMPLDYPGGNADLYLFPFGVAVAHIREHLEPRSIAELAIWRNHSYRDARVWLDNQIRILVPTTARTPYVLSLLWLDRPKWSGDALDTALRLLSMPKYVLDHEDHACPGDELLNAGEMVERALLRSGGVDRQDLVGFGARGESIGYASWSGVAYYPVAPRRALPADEIVAFELYAQAVWCYTNDIRRQVEDGQDPVVPEAYGWRFLRAAQSRLTSPGALESGQHRSMRDAVVSTSGLDDQIRSAIDALR